MTGGSLWPFIIGSLAAIAAAPVIGVFAYRRGVQDDPVILGSVLAGTGRVTRVKWLDPAKDQRDWYRVTVQLAIPELPDNEQPKALDRRFELEPNARPVVGDTWPVEVSATHPSRYRVVNFPARRGSSHGSVQTMTVEGGTALDSRIGEHKVGEHKVGEHKVRGPVLTGTAQALTVHRTTQPSGNGPDRYHYLITFRVKIPGREPYDVIRNYLNMKRIRPYEGDMWEVQVSESDPLTLAVLFARPVPTQPRN